MTDAEHLIACEARYYYRLYQENGQHWWSEKKQKLIKRRGNIDAMEKERLTEKQAR